MGIRLNKNKISRYNYSDLFYFYKGDINLSKKNIFISNYSSGVINFLKINFTKSS